jgi:hypothetical protein
LLGTRAKLLGVVGTLLLLLIVVPVVLIVFGLYIGAALSAVVGLAGLVLVAVALLPGRRW